MHAAFGASAQACIIPTSKSGEPLGSLYATAYRRAALIRAAASISRWGLLRVVWCTSCRFTKLSRNCEYSGQRGLRPVAEDSPYLPEAEASTASLRRCRKGERN